ncbi:MAG TPA: hypothetical protein VFR02_07915, partial [bacterium]|nr:hypothetical protein [bacterium]
MRRNDPRLVAAALTALLSPALSFASPGGGAPLGAVASSGEPSLGAVSSSSEPPLGGVASSSEAPFHPFWTGECSVDYGAEDGGQNGGLVWLGGRETLNPKGGFFEAGVFGRSFQLESLRAGAFGLQMGGGVGLGDLTPSLEVALEAGDSHADAIRVLIGIDKALAPDLTLDFSLTGEVASHQGPLGALVGLPAGSAAEIDDLNAIVGAALKWAALPPLDLSLSLQAESDETVKLQDPSHTLFNQVDTTEWIYGLSLGAVGRLDAH